MFWEKDAGQRRLGDEKGSGLAEVLIALVILSIAIVSLAGTAVRVGTTMNSVHMRLKAMEVAERQVERLHSTQYDLVTNGARTEDGVQMAWVVNTGDVSKRITLVYQYDTPRMARRDTLVAAVRQP
jgi:Tfp pilus assembly protein PilV